MFTTRGCVSLTMFSFDVSLQISFSATLLPALCAMKLLVWVNMALCMLLHVPVGGKFFLASCAGYQTLISMVFPVLLQLTVKMESFVTVPWQQVQDLMVMFSTITSEFSTAKPACVFYIWVLVLHVLVKFL